VIFGKRLKSRLPAKRVPEAVERWLRLYEAERAEGEEFNAFAERTGAESFEAAVKDLTLPAEFSLETMQQFIDWNRSSPYEAERGDELWKRDPDSCCGIRKVEPMREALSSVDCWVAGVRRADSSSRSKTPKFGWDKRFDLWKLNPLADWTERDVWNYIREHH